MPIIKSARKRVRVAQKATIRNSKTKRHLKSTLKNFSKKTTADNLKEAHSAIDKAVKKGVLNKNKAARLKKRAALLAKEANVKIVKSATPKPAAKSTKPVKKPSATKSKPAAKKKA